MQEITFHSAMSLYWHIPIANENFFLNKVLLLFLGAINESCDAGDKKILIMLIINLAINHDLSLKDLLIRFYDFVNDFVDSQLLACTDFTGRDRVISNLSVNQLPKVTFNLCPKSLHKLISELKTQQIIQVA